MDELKAQIEAALPFPATAKLVDMTWCDRGIEVMVYSNAVGVPMTVETRHKATDGVEAIVAAHTAAREPKEVEKTRRARERAHRQVFGPDRLK